MKHFICNQLIQTDSVTKRLEQCGMQKILSSHKNVKGFVAKQICANEPSCHPLEPLTQEWRTPLM